jgi:hypothetical protein
VKAIKLVPTDTEGLIVLTHQLMNYSPKNSMVYCWSHYSNAVLIASSSPAFEPYSVGTHGNHMATREYSLGGFPIQPSVACGPLGNGRWREMDDGCLRVLERIFCMLRLLENPNKLNYGSLRS